MMPDAVRPTRFVLGAMTGTSLDGIDVAAAEIRGTGLQMRARLIRHDHADLGPLGGDLRRAAAQEPMTAETLAGLSLALGERYAEAVAAAAGGVERPDLIAVHGQTIVHRPPISWQLINPAPVALRFNCPVVFDLRQADLVAGGQGAPITPAADWVLFGDPETRRAVVNLGGFCNVTVLGEDGDEPLAGVRGFDVCACNQVLDAAARRGLDAPYDDGGRAALAGEARDDAVAELLEILVRQRTSGQSLGTGDEAGSWVATYGGRLGPEDLAASAVDAPCAPATSWTCPCRPAKPWPWRCSARCAPTACRSRCPGSRAAPTPRPWPGRGAWVARTARMPQASESCVCVWGQ